MTNVFIVCLSQAFFGHLHHLDLLHRYLSIKIQRLDVHMSGNLFILTSLISSVYLASHDLMIGKILEHFGQKALANIRMFNILICVNH